MTRKHFEAIASLISKYTDPLAAPGYDKGVHHGAMFIADELADYFAAENPRFDRARFLKACGL